MSILHKIDIQTASVYFDTKDPKSLNKLQPKRAERRFILEFNKLFGGQGLESIISDSQYKAYLYNRAFVLLPALYKSLHNASIAKNEKLLIDLLYKYRIITGRELLKFSDLKRLQDEITRMQNKYNGLVKDTETPKDVSFDFEKMVIGIEQTLSVQIHRSLKVFQLHSYYLKALEYGRNKNVS